MSNFISSISARGLDRDAPGVEGDALADQHERLCALCRAVVPEHDELRRLARALRDGEQRVHAQALHVAPLEDLDAELPLLRELRRGLGKVRRRAHVARQVAEVLGRRDAGADRSPFGEAARRVAGSRLRRRRDHQAPERAGRALPALHRVEAIQGLRCDGRRMEHSPSEVPVAHRQIGQEQVRVRGARVGERAHCRAHGIAVRLRPELRLLAEPDQQHALGRDSARPVEEPHRAGLAVHVAAFHHGAHRTAGGAIQRLRGGRKLARLENARDYAGARRALWRNGFRAKFQSVLLRSTRCLCQMLASGADVGGPRCEWERPGLSPL